MAIAVVVALGFLALQLVAGNPTYDVVSYGAVGDGKSNDTQAFSKAWMAACADSNYPFLLIPANKIFLLTQITFQGPCKSWINVQLDGNIVAPNEVWTNEVADFITFRNVNNLTVAGHGEIDGNGAIWWACVAKKGCNNRPNLLVLTECNDVWVKGIRMKNGPTKHLIITSCSRVHVKGVEVRAPGDSPNTDALHVAWSQSVEFTDCIVGTGDDCVAVGPGTSDINVTHVRCGPGHGLSIGSLGPNSTVERVRFSDSYVVGATTGARIKTWQGGSGDAKEITFERINFSSVQIPILIDQYYCPGGNHCNTKSTSNVALRNIQFVDLYGTSARKEAIRIKCSKEVPCKDIFMKNVTLYRNDGSSATSSCNSAYGRTEGVVIPKVSFLR